ncbi:hypothetical protein E2C01_010571 [Portunus trituberculatus]|uniref:Uncharacterized protein n=1 Tax=Portunus trituberculatus TaxID=210409 RepID=A0A5B7D8R1_PORTR|nr:hypothetical protein [Portunus trituberculatus]
MKRHIGEGKVMLDLRRDMVACNLSSPARQREAAVGSAGDGTRAQLLVGFYLTTVEHARRLARGCAGPEGE